VGKFDLCFTSWWAEKGGITSGLPQTIRNRLRAILTTDPPPSWCCWTTLAPQILTTYWAERLGQKSRGASGEVDLVAVALWME